MIYLNASAQRANNFFFNIFSRGEDSSIESAGYESIFFSNKNILEFKYSPKLSTQIWYRCWPYPHCLHRTTLDGKDLWISPGPTTCSTLYLLQKKISLSKFVFSCTDLGTRSHAAGLLSSCKLKGFLIHVM